MAWCLPENKHFSFTLLLEFNTLNKLFSPLAITHQTESTRGQDRNGTRRKTVYLISKCDESPYKNVDLWQQFSFSLTDLFAFPFFFLSLLLFLTIYLFSFFRVRCFWKAFCQLDVWLKQQNSASSFYLSLLHSLPSSRIAKHQSWSSWQRWHHFGLFLHVLTGARHRCEVLV